MRGLPTERIEVDELWSFVGCKERTKKLGGQGHGDAWVWGAIDADHKLAVGYLVGDRDAKNARDFMKDVASRLTRRVQLTSDGHGVYPQAAEAAFGGKVDSQLIKEYEAERACEARHSPPRCTGCTRRAVQGNPDPELISTSYVERSNLSFRMSSRRFTRLTTGYSRLLANHVFATALHLHAHNWIKKHATLKKTPAVAAGLADRAMTWLDFVDLLEREEKARGGRLTDYQQAKLTKKAEAN